MAKLKRKSGFSKLGKISPEARAEAEKGLRVTKIGITLSATVPLGNYASIKPGIYLEADIEVPKSVKDRDQFLRDSHLVLAAKAKWLLLREAYALGIGKEAIGKVRDESELADLVIGYFEANPSIP